MTETLRELVSALSLEKAISHTACQDNQQIKEAESSLTSGGGWY